MCNLQRLVDVIDEQYLSLINRVNEGKNALEILSSRNKGLAFLGTSRSVLSFCVAFHEIDFIYKSSFRYEKFFLGIKILLVIDSAAKNTVLDV